MRRVIIVTANASTFQIRRILIIIPDEISFEQDMLAFVQRFTDFDIDSVVFQTNNE